MQKNVKIGQGFEWAIHLILNEKLFVNNYFYLILLYF